MQRASIVGLKRTLDREVSMSRTFKEKPKQFIKPKQREEPKPAKPRQKNNLGKTLIAETPAKKRIAPQVAQGSQVMVLSPPPTSSPGDVFIGETPIASRTAPRMDVTEKISSLSPLTPLKDASSKKPATDAIDVDAWEDEDADESFTGSFGSPEVMLLSDGPEMQKRGAKLTAMKPGLVGKKGGARSLSVRMASAASAAALESETPTKKRARRK